MNDVCMVRDDGGDCDSFVLMMHAGLARLAKQRVLGGGSPVAPFDPARGIEPRVRRWFERPFVVLSSRRMSAVWS